MATKRLFENPPSASSLSGEEDNESVREENPVDSDSESDNTISAFKIIPIIPKSAMRVVYPEPDRPGDTKAITASAVETPKKNRKVRAVKGESPVVLSKEPDQKFSDLSKKANAFANTDVLDVKMSEPCDPYSNNELTFHITLGLPCKRALGKRQKLGKAKVVASKDASVSKRLKGKENVVVVRDRESSLGDNIVALSGRLEGEGKAAAEDAGKEHKTESLIGDGRGVWWEDLSKIGIAKAEELKEKWKLLRLDELELFIMKKELLKQIAVTVIDSMMASRS